MSEYTLRIAVLGLGYVGLPLALELSKHFSTIGFDINTKRIADLREGIDDSGEVEADALRSSSLQLSCDPDALRSCTLFIIAVPTPISSDKQPDLAPLLSASRMLAPYLKPADIVIYESTVYPGCTREACVPILEQGSGLRLGQHFEVGYSPERINPGDKHRRLPDIIKVVSASSDAALEVLAKVYGKIIKAGLHLAPSIEVAEAAKALENTQRDVNIALINEFAQIAERLHLDYRAVLEAAGTKWNFLPFKPGLVGGHCIGVDPYYLIFKAQQTGYFPELISASRRINEAMPAFLATKVVKQIVAAQINLVGARVLLLGGTFKPDCPDLRNTKVVELARELQSYGLSVSVHDPWIVDSELAHEEGLPMAKSQDAAADVVILVVAHAQFLQMGPAAMQNLGKPGALFIDLLKALP
jgi:UDP-N-acetyl-D-galactosamine dehydrogenase